MRVLYVVGDPAFSLADSAGYTRHILQCVGALRDLGHEVRLLTSCSGAGIEHQKQAFSRVKRFTPPLFWAVAKDVRRLIYDRGFESKIEEAAREFKPDVIYDRLALFHRSAVAVGKRLRIPTILEVNARIAREADRYYRLGLKSLAARIEQEVYRNATAIAVVSAQLKEDLAGCGLPADTIYVNPNGVDTQEFNPSVDASLIRERYGLAGLGVIGFVGSLAPWHGVDNLLESARLVCRQRPDARFLIVGSGDEYESLSEKARQYGIGDKVLFTGAASHDEVPMYINAMDIATAPYPHMERFYFSPIKIFEYMAAERAVVASNLGQIGEVIDDGRSGVLVKAGDIEHLARKLILLLDSPELRKELGLNARAAVLGEYTWKRNAERIVDICRALSS